MDDDDGGGRRRLMDLKSDGTFDSRYLPQVYVVWKKVTIYCAYNDNTKSSELLRDCIGKCCSYCSSSSSSSSSSSGSRSSSGRGGIC